MDHPRKTLIVICVLALVAIIPCYAQPKEQYPSHTNKFSAGASGGHYGYDPGVAIEMTTPSFFRNHLRARIRGNIQWLEAYKASYNDWVTYKSYSAALVYHTKVIDRARFYVELGVFAIIPHERFSGKRFLYGFYEFNGMEVFLFDTSHYSLAFYLGLGPAFIEAYAEKLERTPRYGYGLQYSNGVRFYF